VRVALLCNLRPGVAAPDVPDDLYEEYDSGATIDSILAALRGLQMEAEAVPADARLPWRLAEGAFDFVFNIAEGTGRRCREAVPAAVCELLGLPFTGPDALTLALTLDKFLAKRVVSPDVPVARGVVIGTDEVPAGLAALQFPVIVKPNDEGSSKGICEGSVCTSAAAALQRCGWLQERYRCPVLIEEFVAGTEVTVAVAGNPPNVRLLGMMEIAPVSPRSDFIYSVEVKRDWRRQVRYYVPPRLNGNMVDLLEKYAFAAYRLLGCRDMARMDFRVGKDGIPCFIECNPLPGLDPVNSDVVLLSRDVMPYEKLVQGILLDAMRRSGKEARAA